MKEAFEEIQRLIEDPATHRIAEYRDLQLRDQIQREHDGRKAGIEKRIEQGMEQGAAERDKQMS